MGSCGTGPLMTLLHFRSIGWIDPSILTGAVMSYQISLSLKLLETREETEAASPGNDHRLLKTMQSPRTAKGSKIVITQCNLNYYGHWCCASDYRLGCFEDQATCMTKCPAWSPPLGSQPDSQEQHWSCKPRIGFSRIKEFRSKLVRGLCLPLL